MNFRLKASGIIDIAKSKKLYQKDSDSDVFVFYTELVSMSLEKNPSCLFV